MFDLTGFRGSACLFAVVKIRTNPIYESSNFIYSECKSFFFPYNGSTLKNLVLFFCKNEKNMRQRLTVQGSTKQTHKLDTCFHLNRRVTIYMHVETYRTITTTRKLQYVRLTIFGCMCYNVRYFIGVAHHQTPSCSDFFFVVLSWWHQHHMFRVKRMPKGWVSLELVTHFSFVYYT